MSNRLIRVALPGLAALSLASWCAAQDASISTRLAPLRAEAHSAAAIVSALPRGTEVEILARDGDYARVQVKGAELTGWVFTPDQQWATTAPVAATPAVETTRPETTETATATRSQAPATSEPAVVGRHPSIEPIELYLTMTPLDAEVVFRKEPYDRSSFPVAVRMDGVDVPGRVTVSGSFSRIFIKKSLRIQLEGPARWNNNRRISLDAMATDPSYLREWAAWDLAHALGMVGPDIRMVRLFINGQYIGPFMFFDWIDAGMMERRGLGGDGVMHHPIDSTYCGNFGDDRLEELKRCWFQFSPPGGNFSELQALTRELNETPTEDFEQFLDSRFDTDSVINWILLNTITSNSDTYNKNYFLYQSRKTGKWIIIPWDYDLSFGRNADPALPYPKNILNDNFQYFYTPELGNSSPLKDKLLANPALYKRFKTRLAHVLGVERDPGAPETAFGWFHPDRFSVRLGDWARTLLPDIDRDRYRASPPETFLQHIEALDYYNIARYTLLRHQVLGQSVFGTARWLPAHSYPLLEEPEADAHLKRRHTPIDYSGNVILSEPGVRVVPIDEQFSRPLGIFQPMSLAQPVRVRLEAETERPPLTVPPSKKIEECIERTWFADLKTPETTLTTRITLEYLEENSLHHEVGSAIRDQSKISLWANTANAWHRLPTHANGAAKTLTTEALTLYPGQVVRMVACAD